MTQTQPTVTVEQGPEWLANFYFSPPPWVNPALKLIAAIVLIVVAYRLYQRDWQLDMDTQREMQIVVAIVVGIMTATLAMANLADVPYTADVVVGTIVGYGAVLVPQHPSIASWWSDTVADPRQRRAYVWFALAVAALALPPLVAVDGMGVMLTSTRMYLTALSASLAFYDIMLFENQPARQAAEA